MPSSCALLQVLFSFPSAFYDESYFSWSLRRTDSTIVIDEEIYFREKDVQNIDKCLEVTDCYRLDMEGLTPDDAQFLDISFDSVSISPFDSTWPNVFSAEFGACTPQCDDDSSLLELEIYYPEYRDVKWDVVPSNSQPILLFEDTDPVYDTFIIKQSICQPKTECFKLSIFSWFGNHIQDTKEDEVDFKVTWDGKTMVEPSTHGFTGTFYEATFGSCEDGYSWCGTNETLLDVYFLNYDYNDPESNVEYTLSDTSSLTEPVQTGTVIDGTMDKGTYFYHIQNCVPQTSCLSLKLQSNETHTKFSKVYVYVRFGNDIYKHDEVFFTSITGSNGGRTFRFEDETFIGTYCGASSVCKKNKYTKSLATLQFVTDDQGAKYNWDLRRKYFHAGTDRVVEGRTSMSGTLMRFDSNVSYIEYMCLPEDECVEFKINKNGMDNLQSFQISRDGIIYDDTNTIGENITVVALPSESDGCDVVDGGSNNDDVSSESPSSESPTSSSPSTSQLLSSRWYLAFFVGSFFAIWMFRPC